MTVNWIEAGGEYQLLFFGAASKSLKGERDIRCPKCKHNSIRAYFHAFNNTTGRGTIWAWCPHCRTYSHLPRVRPEGLIFPDPFADLNIEEFAEMEQDTAATLLDKLDQLWDRGEIGYPEKTTVK